MKDEQKLRPIETAPKDGTVILLFNMSKYNTCTIGAFCDHIIEEQKRWLSCANLYNCDLEFEPTHWAELPSMVL